MEILKKMMEKIDFKLKVKNIVVILDSIIYFYCLFNLNNNFYKFFINKTLS